MSREESVGEGIEEGGVPENPLFVPRPRVLGLGHIPPLTQSSQHLTVPVPGAGRRKRHEQTPLSPQVGEAQCQVIEETNGEEGPMGQGLTLNDGVAGAEYVVHDQRPRRGQRCKDASFTH